MTAPAGTAAPTGTAGPAARPVASESGTSLTAPRRGAARGWIAIGAALIVVGGAAAAILGIAQLPAQGLLDPEAAGPDGARAIVEVMRDHGVEVTVARDLGAARAALADGPATLVVTDTAPLSDDGLTELAAQSADTVLVDPRSRDLRLLLPGTGPAGVGSGTADPDCSLPEARRAGAVAPGAVFDAASGDLACYPSGDGHGLVVAERGDRRIVAVDGASLFTNARLAEDGNAALGIGLIARQERVVWYLPGLFDSDLPAATVTLGELTPAWVTPAITLLAAAAIAAGVWRGRRLGPLVRESLPVTVRAGETTQGRARLYARAGDAAHAADQLRIAALRRLARRLGLGAAASAAQIADATAARLGADRTAVAATLITAPVHTDRELVELADRLRALESAAPRGPGPGPAAGGPGAAGTAATPAPPVPANPPSLDAPTTRPERNTP